MVPQDGLPMLPPSALSQLVVNRAKRTGGIGMGACEVYGVSGGCLLGWRPARGAAPRATPGKPGRPGACCLEPGRLCYRDAMPPRLR